jgi:hypothetical protein
MSFWSAIANFFKGFFRSVPALVTGIAVGWATWGAGPVLAGILGGVTAAVVNTAINGGNWGQAIGMGAVLGGIAGGIGGDVFKGFGGVADKGFNWGNFVAGVKTGAAFGAVIGGINTAIHGGNVFQNVALGALGGVVSAAAAYGVSYGINKAWERYYYGKEMTDDPWVTEGIAKHQQRFPNQDFEGVRVFVGGKALPPEGYNGRALDKNTVILDSSLDPSNKEQVTKDLFINKLSHELGHVAHFRTFPNFLDVYRAMDHRYGYWRNPFEWLAEKMASEVSGFRMNPLYRMP